MAPSAENGRVTMAIDPLIRLGADQVLGIRIDGDEFCPVDAFFHHAGDRVRSPTTTTNHSDLGLELGQDLVKVFVILRG
jgi:hypothetical protein